LNSAPLTPAGLRGHVVLVSFGTYTCINWIRSLPYVRASADTYSAPGELRRNQWALSGAGARQWASMSTSRATGTADYQRMNQLIRQPPPIRERRFEIEFLDAGVEAFVFTFG
jgi:hypothetical protein